MADTPLHFSEDQFVPAKELNRRPGYCLDRAQEQDLVIQREGRSVAALVGYQHYRRLRDFAKATGRTHSLDEVLAENGLTDAELES